MSCGTGRRYQSAVLLGRVNQDSMEQLLGNTPRAASATTTKTTAQKSTMKRKTDKMKDLKKSTKKDEGNQKKGKGMVSSLGPPVDGSGEHYLDQPDRLDKIVQDLIRQHKEKDSSSCLEESTSSHCDLRAQYSSMLNSNSIDEIKDMLANAIRENFELKQELLKKDAKFLELQLDQINSNLRKRHSRRSVNPSSKYELCQVLEEATAAEKDLKVRLAKTEIDLIDKTNVLREVGARMEMLGEKCERLEAENLFLRKTHENCVKSLRAKNEILEKRCEKTDIRRKLDRAGLSEEIRECKWLLKNLSQNVGKCVKLYADAKAELKAQQGRKDSIDLELTYAENTNVANSKPDRLSNWLFNTNQKVAQTAMALWTEYLNQKVNHLEGKVARTKTEKGDEEEDMQILYSARPKKSNVDDEDEGYPYEDYADVPPSPTWIRICNNAGLSFNMP